MGGAILPSTPNNYATLGALRPSAQINLEIVAIIFEIGINSHLKTPEERKEDA
jgi:hypothetical protein